MTMLRIFFGLAFVGVLSSGCYEEGGTLPLVFPNEGRTGWNNPGSTAAILIDSNYIPLDDLDEWHDLSPERVQVWIVDKSDPKNFLDEQASVRAVFNLSPDPFSEWGLTQQGISGTVALFDLPSHQSMGSFNYPQNVWVEVRTVDPEAPAPVFAERIASFKLTGTGGSPQPLMAEGIWPGSEAYWLQRREQPVVRLRAKRIGFESGQTIGSIEFELEYNLGAFDCVESITAAKQATEADGVAMVGAAVSETQKVILVSPDGFQLTFTEDPLEHDDSLAGEGPFLDLLIEKGLGCDLATPGWFEVRNLKVSDLDGVSLIDEVDVGVDFVGAEDEDALLRAYLIDPCPMTECS